MDKLKNDFDRIIPWIEGFKETGIQCTPLNGKVPIYKNWVEKETPEYTEFIGHNYGVVLTHNMLVIDFDPRRDTEGNELDSFLKDSGFEKLEDLKTFIVISGGGGYHIYLKKPMDVLIKGKHPKYHSIEFKSKGNQVVGPGSIHPDTDKEYTPYGEEMEINDCPDSILKIVKKRKVSELKPKPEIENFIENCASVEFRRYKKYLLEEAPFATEGQNGDVTTLKVAHVGRDYGLAPELTLDLMLQFYNPHCIPPWDPEELLIKVRNAYTYNQNEVGIYSTKHQFKKEYNEKVGEAEFVTCSTDLTRHKTGKIKNEFNNICKIMTRWRGTAELLRYNEITREIELTRKPPWLKEDKEWTDSKINNLDDHHLLGLKYILHERFLTEFSSVNLSEAIKYISHLNSFNPVQIFLDQTEWDGVPRLDTWLHDHMFVENNEYSRFVGRKFLIGAIHRALNPGCKWDYCLVLEGPQGIGKSELLSILGGDWYAALTISKSNNESEREVCGSWIIELDEMLFIKKTDVDHIKAFMTRKADKYRDKWDILASNHKRSCVFIGTINPSVSGYLKDPSGARRFWPVYCNATIGQINHVKFKEIVKQLWAEAYAAYKNREVSYPTKKHEFEMLAFEVDKRREEHPWKELIEEYLEENKVTAISTSDLWQNCFYGDKAYSHVTRNNVAEIMDSLGWLKGRKVVNGIKKTVWFPKDKRFSKIK